MDHIPVYSGNHVSLGVVQEGYLPQLMQFINDPEAVQGIIVIPPVYEDTELEWLRSLSKKKSDAIFALLAHIPGDPITYAYIGNTGLHSITWPHGTAVTGTLMGNRTFWERGIGTEAKLLLMKHAFDTVGLRKLTSTVKAFNARSLGHLLKCGYHIVGIRKDHFMYQGRLIDEVLLDGFRADWEPIWETHKESGALPKLTEEQRKLVCSIVEKAEKK